MEATQGSGAAHSARATIIQTRPLAPFIGAEILGVDLRDDLSAQVVEAIRDTWHDNGVILIRGQQLDEAAQVKFAQRFGELGKVLHAHEGRTSLPGVMYISNVRENGKLIGALPDGEMYFHSDQCYIENPSVGTMLFAMEVPSKGGDTIFANMFAAYDELPDDLKRKIEGRKALNVYDYQNAATVRGSEVKEGVPSFAHPMVKAHSATGRKAL
jgi:taurine dioxygenase